MICTNGMASTATQVVLLEDALKGVDRTAAEDAMHAMRAMHGRPTPARADTTPASGIPGSRDDRGGPGDAAAAAGGGEARAAVERGAVGHVVLMSSAALIDRFAAYGSGARL